MKKMAIASDHKKFFEIHGYISFEELVPSEEIKVIFKLVQERSSELPGLNQENLFRSLPAILNLERKLARVSSALLDRKPIRIAHDAYIEKLSSICPIGEREIGVLLDATGKGLFFNQLPSDLYKGSEPCYLFMIFTANFVNNPIVFQ